MRAIGLPRRTYYNWKHYQASSRRKKDEVIKPKINEIWQNNYKVYGAPHLRVSLRTTCGIKIGTWRVKRLMNELNIHSLMIRRFKKQGTQVDYAQTT
ncbi:IS3 family transposase [Nicoliella spurrieriana]|uniref:IS3 family transposase n=1 Tax=Nicoliella spurrieriana TaxID=2925830 RepID=UPI003C6E0071